MNGGILGQGPPPPQAGPLTRRPVATGSGRRYVVNDVPPLVTYVDVAPGNWQPLGVGAGPSGPVVSGTLKLRRLIALARAGLADIRIACVGDSIVLGTNEAAPIGTDFFSSWTTWASKYAASKHGLITNYGRDVRASLQSLAQGGATANPGTGPPWVAPSGWTLGGMNGLRANAAPTGAATLTSINSAGLKVWTWQNTGATSSGTLTIDGGAPSTVVGNSGSSILTAVQTFSAAAGSHTYALNCTAGIFVAAVVEVIPPVTGTVSLTNYGVGASNTSTWIATGTQGGLNGPIELMNPTVAALLAYDIVVMSLGINDWQNRANNPQQYYANMASMIRTMTTAGSLVVLVVEPPPANPLSNQATWWEFVKAQYALARDFNLPIIDPTPQFIDRATMQAQGYTNAIHTEPPCAAEYGRIVAEGLFN